MSRTVQCLIATRSHGKIREIREIMGSATGLCLLTLDEVGIEPTQAEEEIEIFDTFRDNAVAKALYFARLTGIPTIADDSGIAVDALGGAPGVRSKRFAAESTPTADPRLGGYSLDQANNQLLLQRLRGLPTEHRKAHYACVAALAIPGRPILTAIGTCSGLIAEHPHGDKGFGYDPIFLLPDLGLTFAEVPLDEKNRRSHRARAFNALRAHLQYFLKIPSSQP